MFIHMSAYFNVKRTNIILLIIQKYLFVYFTD